MREAQGRVGKWSHSSASCSVVGTTITCSGSGSVTSDMVQQAGAYTKYEVARIEWGVTRIENDAFRMCSSLTNITIAESVVFIGSQSFEDIKATSITFPSSVTELHFLAVNLCRYLVNVNMAFQNGTYTSENGMIMLTKDGYKGLYMVGAGRCNGTTFQIPSVDKIWGSAVRWNQATVMKVPDSVIEIQGAAFYACQSMHTLELGKGLQTMHIDAMNFCPALSTIILHSDNTYFYHKNESTGQIFGKKQSGSTNPQSILWISISSEAITIPGTVTEVSGSALRSCPNLASITVESTSETFSAQCGGLVLCSKDGSTAKYGAGGAVDVIVNDAVKFFGLACFKGVTGLKSVKFHSGIIGCASECFRECHSLHTVDFASCTMRSGTGSSASHTLLGMMFAECHSLKTILNWPINSFSVQEAGFYNCSFENLVLPQTMIALGKRAFEYSSKLHTVTIPKTLTKIEWLAFAHCPQLKNMIFESNSTLKQIDTLGIAHCQQLETITLPVSLTNMDNSCFAGDIMLTSITFETNSGIYHSENGAVYKDNRNTFYLSSPGVSSVIMHQDTRVIATHAFYWCNNIVHVDLSSSVERIEEQAFFECTNIKSVRLYGGVRFIGSRALATCVNLQSVFYCDNTISVELGSNPFTANCKVYAFYDFPDQTFYQYPCYAVLDHQCNIPTTSFTIAWNCPTRVEKFCSIMWSLHAYRLLVR